MKNLILFLLFFISCELSCQNDRSDLLEVKSHNVFEDLNTTQWTLKYILEKKWIFKTKRKIRNSERLELSINNGKIKYFYVESKKEVICTYRPSSDKKNEYEYMTVECENYNYYWTVFKLSDEKFVMKVGIDLKKNYEIKDLGRYIFYKKK